MGRIRSIKPEFFQHEDLYDAEKESGLPLRVAFAGLWTQADREGRFEWRPVRLKISVLPYDDVDFATVLEALESAGFIRSYTVSRKKYGYIPSWKTHQRTNHREPPSTFPDPPEQDDSQKHLTQITTEALPDAPSVDEVENQPCINGDYYVTREGEGKGRGMEGKGKGTSPPLETKIVNHPETPEGLARLWVFVCTRKRNGICPDREGDLVPQFQELIRLGHSPKDLMKTVVDPGRDHSEQFFHLSDRLKKQRESASKRPRFTEKA